MNWKRLIVSSAVAGMFLATVGLTFGQGQSDFEIKEIRQQLVTAPTGISAGDLGGTPATLWRQWLKIEVLFASNPTWSDDVQVKYYVLLSDLKGDRKLFVGDVTHVNVSKGSQHYSAMFMHPNAVQRYGGKIPLVVTARIFYKGAVVAEKTMAPGISVIEGWWDKFSPIPGYLLSPQETPWAPVANDRFEAIKVSHP